MPIFSLATRTRARHNTLLSRRPSHFRNICNARLGLSTSESDHPVAGTKFLESFKEEFEVGSRIISLETGKIARFANGSVVLGMEDTKVLSTVSAGKGDVTRDFLPLTVDYQEKQFAQGVIPSTFMRREGAPKERELLCGRLIDRPIRPLFPAGFYHEIQVMASVLSSDGKQDPDVLAANATSAALMLSDIPWGGPIGVVRIGRICGQFVVNPTVDELSLSDLNLVYACTRDKTLMIDVQAREITEKDLEAGLRLAHPEAVKYLEPQIRLAASAGKQKKEYKLSMVSEQIYEKVRNLAEAPIGAIFTDPSYGKFERGEALAKITEDVKSALVEEYDEQSLNVLPKVVDTVRKKVVRKRIISEGCRLDGRHLDEVRPIYCETGNLPILHGSALFNRGDTQVLCTVTLGAPQEAQRLDSLVGPPKKRFMLHYSFPPFCIDEIGKQGGLNRREVGHGTLAEKALLAVLPPEDDFPYTVRINSEVMASDGSTSMATVCGGSMALMDAGIPLREHVAGVSVGLITDVDSKTGEITDYRILTDILGLEDHLGDMDFKIAGTRNGVTAIQLDIKPAGIPLDIVCESLEPARKARFQILEHMEQEIRVPRNQDDRNSPRLVTLKFSNDAIRQFIGPLGALKRKVEEETGARISVGDGTITIAAKNQAMMEKVQEKVDFIVGREIEVGGIYKGVVQSIKEYGAFVEFNGGQQGLLHISELSHEPVSRISDVVSVGQQISLMCIGQDVRGNIKLSLKATKQRPGLETKGVVEGFAPVTKEKLNIWASLENLSKGKQQKSTLDEVPLTKMEKTESNQSASSQPAVVIRSSTECDEKEKFAPVTKEEPDFWASLKSLSKGEHQKSTLKEVLLTKMEKTESDQSASSQPAVVIRSAAECDEKEKFAGLSKASKSAPKPKGTLKRDTKPKEVCSSDNKSGLSKASKSAPKPKGTLKRATKSKEEPPLTLSSMLSESLSEMGGKKNFTSEDEDEDEANLNNQNNKETGVKTQSEMVGKKKFTSEDEDEAKLNNQNNKETGVKTHVTPQKLKIGTEVTAKIYQIRVRGLVLDLGGGIRGMYKFEHNDEREFTIGDELQVRCSSFTSKGIPVMSMVDDEE